MTAIFDLDDTISVHRNRDYENAVPIKATVERMRALKAAGWRICIYSARGQHSCRGNLALIEARNRSIVEKWLAKHNVPCDELVFGKPLGDIYIDDKGMNLSDFLSAPIEQLHGNSGAEIHRLGTRVFKRGPNARETADWYRAAAEIGVHVPEVYSVVLDTLCLKYINGTNGRKKREVTPIDIYGIVSIIMLFSLKKSNCEFSAKALTSRAREHLAVCDRSYNTRFERLFEYIEQTITEEYTSFCHGDLALSNTVFCGDSIYLIDPIPATEYSSYLMDFAKLRFSLDGGETFLNGTTNNYEAALDTLNCILNENNLTKQVLALEATYWLRLLKYTAPARREDVINHAEALQAWL